MGVEGAVQTTKNRNDTAPCTHVFGEGNREEEKRGRFKKEKVNGRGWTLIEGEKTEFRNDEGTGNREKSPSVKCITER